MKKGKILLLLLVAAALAAALLIPASAETAQAGDMAALSDAFAAGGNVALTGDVTLTANLSVAAGKTVALDLAGHTLTMAGKTFSVSGTFYLYSSVAGAKVTNAASKGVLVTVGAGSNCYIGGYPGTTTPDDSIRDNLTFTGSQFVKASGDGAVATVNFYGGSYTYSTATSYYSAFFDASKQSLNVNVTKATMRMTKFQGAKAYATDAIVQQMNAGRTTNVVFTDSVIEGTSPMEVATSGKTAGTASALPSTVVFNNCTLTNVALSASLCPSSTITLNAGTTFNVVSYGSNEVAYDVTTGKTSATYPNFSIEKGYVVKSVGDGRYEVMENFDPVVTVDGEEYPSFEKAVTAAIAAGNGDVKKKVTVKLLMNTTTAETVSLVLNPGFEFCLDLAGHTLAFSGAGEGTGLFALTGSTSTPSQAGILHIYSSEKDGLVDCVANLLTAGGGGITSVTLGAYDGNDGDNLTVTCYRVIKASPSESSSTYMTVDGGTYISDSAQGSTQDSMFQAQKQVMQIAMKDAHIKYAQSSSKQFFIFGQVSTPRTYTLTATGCTFEGNFTAFIGDNGKGYDTFRTTVTDCDFIGDIAKYRFCQPTGITIGDGCRLSAVSATNPLPLAEGAVLAYSSDPAFPYFIETDTATLAQVEWKTLLGETLTEYWKIGDTPACREVLNMSVGNIEYGYFWTPTPAALEGDTTFVATFDSASIPKFSGQAELTDRITFHLIPPTDAGITVTGVTGAGECSFTAERATVLMMPEEAYKPVTVTFTVTIGENVYEGFTRTYSLLSYAAAMEKSDHTKIAAVGKTFRNYVYYTAMAFDPAAPAYFTEKGIEPYAMTAVTGGSETVATKYLLGASLTLESAPFFNFYLRSDTPDAATVSISYTDVYGRARGDALAVSALDLADTTVGTCLVASFPLSLCDMRSEVTVTVTGDDPLTYSLTDYIYGVSAAGGNTDAATALWHFTAALEEYAPETVELYTYDDPFPLVPEVIRAYLAAAKEYDLNDYTYTLANADIWSAYGAVPVVLRWAYSHPEKITSATLSYSENADMTDAATLDVGRATSASLENLYAGVTYYWQITATDGTSIWESPVGTFSTEAGPRILTVGGVDNVRDVGGWLTTDGKLVKNGLVYRTAKLEKITAAGRAFMRDELGIRTELDLRSDQDLINMNGYVITTSPLGEDIQYIHISSSQYQSYFNPKYTDATVAIMRVFADLDNYPIVFHCMGGADRTGTLAFMLKAILGVAENDLVADYELTSGKTRNNTASGYDFQAMIRSFHGFGGTNAQENAINVYTATLGLTWQEISNIQNIMLSDSAVFNKASLAAITVAAGGEVSLSVNLRESGSVTSVTVGGADTAFTFAGDTLTFTAPATAGTYRGTVTFADGATLGFGFTVE